MADNELLIRAAIADELSAPLQAIKTEVNEVTAAVGRLDAAGRAGAGRGLAQMSTAVGGLGKLAKSAHGTLLDLSRGALDAVWSYSKRAAEGVGLLAVGLTYMGVKAARNIETARLGVETFVGDVTKGDALFGQLRKLTGPFNLAEVTEASQALLTASDGADHLIPRMKALADIAATQANPSAALNTLAESLNKIQESGVIDARVLRPLMGAGVPVYELLASELGVPVAQVKKTLASGAPIDLPVKFLTDIENEAGPLAKFQGGLERQKQTLSGQFQGIMLSFKGALGDVFEPLGDSLKTVTPLLKSGLLDLVRGVGPSLIAFLTALVALVAGLIPILQPIAASLLGAFAQIAQALVPALAALAPQVPALATAFANLVIALIPLIPPLTQLLVALTPIVVLTLERFTAALTNLVTAVTPLITKFAEWIDHSSTLRSVLSDVLIGILAYAAIARIVGVVLGFAKALIAVKDAIIAIKAAQSAGGILRILTGAPTATAASSTAAEIGAVATETTGLSAAIAALTPVLAVLAPVAESLAMGYMASKIQSDNAANNAQFGDYDTAARIDPGGRMRAKVQAGDRADADYWLRTGKSPAAAYMDPHTERGTAGTPYDARGYAQAQADLSAMALAQGLPAGALAGELGPAPGAMDAAGGGVIVHVAGDVVGETSNIFSRIAGAVNQAMTDQQRNKVERGAAK